MRKGTEEGSKRSVGKMEKDMEQDKEEEVFL